jgi:DMSO/TMAO reductase YedYZ molybdopterin-dependent catalytic subunit
MEARNFYILVASICVFLVAFWLTAYNVVRLGIDPIEYIQQSSSSSTSDEEDEDLRTVIIIKGKVTEELRLSLTELKSDKYTQVTADFDFKNSYGTEWTSEYTGATLWSILEGILESDATTFVFVGDDGYESPVPLSLKDIAKAHENQVILAYELEGEPLSSDTGPIRSVVDREPIKDLEPDHYNSHFSVKELKYVEIA